MMTLKQAEAWMNERFPAVGERHGRYPQWHMQPPEALVYRVPMRRWVWLYLRKCTEDPAYKDHYFREALRIRREMEMGAFRVNVMDGTGRSYAIIPGLPLDHKWQYTREDAR